MIFHASACSESVEEGRNYCVGQEHFTQRGAPEKPAAFRCGEQAETLNPPSPKGTQALKCKVCEPDTSYSSAGGVLVGHGHHNDEESSGGLGTVGYGEHLPYPAKLKEMGFHHLIIVKGSSISSFRVIK